MDLKQKEGEFIGKERALSILTSKFDNLKQQLNLQRGDDYDSNTKINPL